MVAKILKKSIHKNCKVDNYRKICIFYINHKDFSNIFCFFTLIRHQIKKNKRGMPKNNIPPICYLAVL
ncbi:hypothetical protein SAMN05216518_10766 [Bacteroidales bacterium KHT7]|nr:hypothetical protein SAMN05216518_10766 [Bacteroidales bacterium KHT7]